MNMWHTFGEKPESGKKIIALYNDGSGAALYFVHDGGFIDGDGDECEELSEGIGTWAYLPDDFEFWCEIRAEDPVTLGPILAAEGR